MLPSASRSGVMTWKPGPDCVVEGVEVDLAVVEELALDLDARVFDVAAEPPAPRPAASDTGAAWARSAIEAISPCFQSSRRICQLPSAMRNATPTSGRHGGPQQALVSECAQHLLLAASRRIEHAQSRAMRPSSALCLYCSAMSPP